MGPTTMPEDAARELEEEEKNESQTEQVLRAYASGSQDMALMQLLDSLFNKDKEDDMKEHEMGDSGNGC